MLLHIGSVTLTVRHPGNSDCSKRRMSGSGHKRPAGCMPLRTFVTCSSLIQTTFVVVSCVGTQAYRSRRPIRLRDDYMYSHAAPRSIMPLCCMLHGWQQRREGNCKSSGNQTRRPELASTITPERVLF